MASVCSSSCATCFGRVGTIFYDVWIPLGTLYLNSGLFCVGPRSKSLTFRVTFYQIETVISSAPLSCPHLFHRREMATREKCTPIRLKPPDNAPLRLVWTILPRVLDWPPVRLRHFTCHVPRAPRCITRIMVIRLDKNPSGRTCTDKCNVTLRTAIDSRRE